MSLLDTLRKNLTPDLFSQVTDALGDDFNYDLVPRTRLNKVIGQRDKALRDLEHVSQGIAPTDDEVDDEDAEGESVEGSKQKKASTSTGITQKQLQDAIDAEKAKAAEELKNLKMRFAITEKLHGANVVDPDMVLNAGLIDFSKVLLSEQGAITGGLDEQIATLVKDRPYLVSDSGGSKGHKGTGKDGSSDQFSSVVNREEFLKLSAEKQMEFKNSNPEAFKQFMQNLQ